MNNQTLKTHLIQNYPWHLDAFEYFERYQKLSRLPSGLIIYGRQKVGKSAFTKLITKSLLCQKSEMACLNCSDCELVDSSNHPNLIEIGLEPGSKQIKLHSKINSPEPQLQISDLIRLLAYSESQNKVAIINPADTINKAAANALLKTLEELGQNKHIIFITNQLHRLPATIISRCQKIHLRFGELHSVSDETNLNNQNWWLNQTGQNNLNQDEKDKAINQYHNLMNLSHMSIFKALEFREKINLIEDYWKYLAKLIDFKISAHQITHLTLSWDKNFLISASLVLIENMIYQKAINQSGQSLNDFVIKLDCLFESSDHEINQWFDGLVNQLQKVSYQNLNRFYQDIEKVSRMLESPANVQLLFENLFTIFQYLPKIKSYPDTFDYWQTSIRR